MVPTASTWVLSDGRPGHERQALALARALFHEEPRIVRLHAHAPWRWCAPHKLPGAGLAFGGEFARALHHPPTIAIGCGRQMALATRLTRQAGASAVQILDPRMDPRHWDAIIVPEHDPLRGPNVITMTGSLHEVNADSLAAARAQYPRFSVLASPRTALLLGGPVADAPLDAQWWQRTVATLRTIQHRDGGSISVCGSPRTPAWLAEAARTSLAEISGARWFGPEDGENPYAGLLAWADRIVVSPDSINMISEAAATSAAVCVAEPEIARGRHAQFLRALMQAGRVQALAADAAPNESVVPLNEMPRVVAALRSLLAR